MMPESTQEALRQRQARRRRADRNLIAGAVGILVVLLVASGITYGVPVELLLSMLVGGLITWAVSKHYYKKAGDELSRLITTVSRGLEEPAPVAFTRDPSGTPRGLFQSLEGVIAAKGTASGTLTTEGSRPSGESESRAPEGGGLGHGASD
jgi:hypothetical protein